MGEMPGFYTYQDSCHLRLLQKVAAPPRNLVKALPGALLVELPEADRCCGAPRACVNQRRRGCGTPHWTTRARRSARPAPPTLVGGEHPVPPGDAQERASSGPACRRAGGVAARRQHHHRGGAQGHGPPARRSDSQGHGGLLRKRRSRRARRDRRPCLAGSHGDSSTGGVSGAASPSRPLRAGRGTLAFRAQPGRQQEQHLLPVYDGREVHEGDPATRHPAPVSGRTGRGEIP